MDVLLCFALYGSISGTEPSMIKGQQKQIQWSFVDGISILRVVFLMSIGLLYYIKPNGANANTDELNTEEGYSRLPNDIDTSVTLPGEWMEAEEKISEYQQLGEKEKGISTSIVELTEPKPCVIAYNGVLFDLNTLEGKSRWNARFKKPATRPTKPLAATKNQQNNSNIDQIHGDELVKPAYNIASEIGILSDNDDPQDIKPLVPGNKENIALQRPPSSELKKARTDLNVHNPDKPVPSVLDHPMIDKKGKPLRRIFIPGRGWVSAKALEQEKLELIRLFDYQQVEPSESLLY